MIKLPPQAIDLEKAILGAFLLSNESFQSFEGEINSDDFYDTINASIMKAMESLSKKGEVIDILTVSKHLEDFKGSKPLSGWPLAVATLTNSVSSTANLEVHIKLVKQESIKRKLIRIGNEMIRSAYDNSTDVFDILSQTDKEMDQINSSFSMDSILSSKQVFAEIQEKWRLMESGDHAGSIMTGFKEFDTITGGLTDGNVMTLAARPGMGKTTVALQIARNVAKSGINVGVITLEMSAIELFAKVMSGEMKINNRRILRDTPTSYESGLIQNLSSKLNDLGIYFVDAATMNNVQLKSAVRRLVREFDCGLIIIDYLQLLSGDKGGNRETEVSSISRTIKSSAKANKVPIISLSQLNRSVETRGGDKRPQLSDLRESGSIEQDSDMVAFCYRPEYYDIDTYADGLPTANKIELIVAKNRGGAVASAIVDCDLPYSNVFDTPTFDETNGPLAPSMSFDDNPF